jgi:hypothetical protein
MALPVILPQGQQNAPHLHPQNRWKFEKKTAFSTFVFIIHEHGFVTELYHQVLKIW